MKTHQTSRAVKTYALEEKPIGSARTGLTRGTILALSTTIVCWASSFVGIRAGLHAYTPVHLALLRYLTASIVLAFYALVRRMPLPRGRDIPGLAITGIVGIALYNVMLNTGELSVSAGISSFLVNTAPILTALLAMVFLKERLRIWGWVGILVCIIGVAIITSGTSDGFHFSAGIWFVLSAALAQSLYFVWQKPYLARYSPLQCTTYAIWIGTLALLVFSPGLMANIGAASWSATAAVLYLGIFPAALGYVSYAYALARIPATRASSFLYLVPAVTLGIAWFWLGESPTWLALIGGVIAISGVIIVNIFGKTQVR